MTNPVHVLSVAALLLVGFLVGAIVGTLARLLVLRLGRKPAAAASAAVEAAPEAAPLVAAPVIAPLPVAPTPVPPAPADVPVPDFAATMIALANEAPPAAFVAATKPRVEAPSAMASLPEIRPVPVIAPLPGAAPVAAAPAMQPAHVAGETTSGLQVAAPQHENPPEPTAAPAVVAEPRSAEVIPFPTVALEQPADRPTDVVVGGETVAIVDTSDLVEDAPVVVPAAEPATPAAEAELKAAHEDNFLFVGVEAFGKPKAELVPAPEPETKSDTIPVPLIAASAAVDAVVTAELPRPEVIVSAAPEPAQVQPEAEAVTATESAAAISAPLVETPAAEPVAAEAATPEAQPVAAASAEDSAADQPIVVSLDEPIDEDAAMRAIEGNWSPRRTPPRRAVRPVEAPEGANQAVAAAARAVTAARRTAEAVVAEVAEVKVEAGRPVGLSAPRDGRKDDLTHIIGVLPVIETALNTLGIYHFDQVGALSDENIGWIEGHLGVPGRIARELWREQARELSAVLKPRRVAEH